MFSCSDILYVYARNSSAIYNKVNKIIASPGYSPSGIDFIEGVFYVGYAASRSFVLAIEYDILDNNYKI